MSAFRDMLAADAAQWLLDADGEGVEEVVYITAVNEDAKTIYARIRYEPELETVGSEDGERKYKSATALIEADATRGIADPVEGDQVEVDGVRWTITGVSSRIERTLYRLSIRRVDRTNVNAGPGYRQQHGR